MTMVVQEDNSVLLGLVCDKALPIVVVLVLLPSAVAVELQEVSGWKRLTMVGNSVSRTRCPVLAHWRLAEEAADVVHSRCPIHI